MKKSSGQASLPSVYLSAIEEYKNWCAHSLSEDDRACVISFPLYHYTSIIGARGIIESKEIWLTNYKFLNDKAELKHGFDIVHRAIGELRSRQIQKGCMLLDCIADFLTLENIDNSIDFFVGSFTTLSDDMAQWERYADGAKGCSIRFNPKLFEILEGPPPSVDQAVLITPITYDDDSAIEKFKVSIQKALDIYYRALLGVEGEYDKKHTICFMNIMSKELISSSILINMIRVKGRPWKSECEYRFVLPMLKSGIEGFVSIRERDGVRVPYIKYNTQNLFDEIVLGPRALDGAECDIRQALSNVGLSGKVKITRSKASC